MKLISRLIVKPEEFLIPTVLLLIAANLAPLYGVFFLEWEVFPILVLFWVENIIVGLFNVLRMLAVSPKTLSMWLAKIFMVPFFCVHYGMFTAAHGIFIFGIFGGYFEREAGFPDITDLYQALAGLSLGWAILALFLSHAASFVLNYILKREYLHASLSLLMGRPYARVVLLHLTIIFGAFLVAALGSPIAALLVLILLKTFIDIKAHLREHKNYFYQKSEAERAAFTLAGK